EPASWAAVEARSRSSCSRCTCRICRSKSAVSPSEPGGAGCAGGLGDCRAATLNWKCMGTSGEPVNRPEPCAESSALYDVNPTDERCRQQVAAKPVPRSASQPDRVV